MEGFRTRGKPIERDSRIASEASEFEKQGANCSKGTRVTRETQKKEQTARKRLEHLRKQGANRRKGTTEFQKKGQTA